MPRSSRHRSHRSHRRGGSPDRSESEGEEVAAAGAREEAARVSRDPEPERRRSASGKENTRSGNGYAEHGRKRKERVEEALVDVVSDRWNSGVCDDHLVDKRSKSEAHGPVDADRQLDKPKVSGDESKRSSRRAVGSDERVEEAVSNSDSLKRRSEREKDSGRRESTGHYKDDRDRDRERERQREKEWERQKEREREKSRDREREKEREREREREKEREKDRDREQDREHEQEKQKDREMDKKDYDPKHDRYDDGGSRKSSSKTSRVEEEAYSYRRDIEANEIPVKEKYTHSEKQLDKHSRRKDDSEDTNKWAADIRDSDDRKTLSRYEHSKARSSKEQRFDDDKYKEKYKDDYGRDKRQQDDKFLDDRVTRDYESGRADYRSAKDGHRNSEGHYRKDAVQDGDHHDDYGSRYKETRGRKRPPEENDDQYDLKTPSTWDQRVNLEKSSGCGRLDSLIERARPDHSSSPSKLHARSSPSPSSHHEKDQSWHESKLTDHGKREVPYDERNIRQRTSSGRERTAATRLRDRDVENWSSERLKQKDDHHPHDIPSEISTSVQHDRTPRKDKHVSPKQLSEKSPSSGDQRFSGRLSGGRSVDNKGERNSLTKYRDRDGDLSQERSLHQDRTPARVPFREPTPGSSISRGGYFSGPSQNHPLPPPARQRTEDPSFLGSHDDERIPQNGDRRFHGHQKRNDMNSGRGHGHSWNNPPNWPAPVGNGFIPIQHGAPGFHPPVHQFPAPHMFNLRPQMKLNQSGVSYPMHDAHIRSFGWPNPLDESCPPHFWNGGSGVFPSEHYMYGRQEWDQNRTHASSKGWEMADDSSKGLNKVPDGELPVAKEPDSKATAVSESAGGERNSQLQIEQKEIEHLTSKNFEAKDDTKILVKSLESSPGAALNTPLLSKNGAIFSKSYLSRISVSRDLVDSELYNRCMSLLGDSGVTKAPQVTKNEFVQQNNGNIGKIRNHGIPNLFSSLYLKSNSTIFQRAMALHKNQTGKVFALATEATRDTKVLDRAPKESVVNNLSSHHNVDIMVEGSPSKQEPGDGTGSASPAAAEFAGVYAPSAMPQPDEEIEAVAPQAITGPEDMEDVVSPAIEVPADVPDDGVPQVTLEHADLRDATPADAMEDVAPPGVGKSGDSVEFMPPAVTEYSLGKEDASAVASPDGHGIPPSIMHEGADTGMEDEVGKAIGDNLGNCEANSSVLTPELDATANAARDPEALLVESTVNLSRIPNSPESTH